MSEKKEQHYLDKLRNALEINGKTEEDFCEALGMKQATFRAMTVRKAKTPKWIKSFFLGYEMKKKK